MRILGLGLGIFFDQWNVGRNNMSSPSLDSNRHASGSYRDVLSFVKSGKFSVITSPNIFFQFHSLLSFSGSDDVNVRPFPINPWVSESVHFSKNLSSLLFIWEIFY